MRRIALLFTALVMSIGTLAISGSPAPAVADKDCGDFDTQAQAQKFFDDHGPGDPHQLDADGDGIACETNPCPCSTGGGGGGPDNQTLRQRAKVVRVIDGDTVKVKLSNGSKRDVRLLGIDTPEVFGVVECWGRKASRAAKRMLARGTRVTLTSDPSQDPKDRYGRLLRYVAKGKTDINHRMVRHGHARVYVYNHNPFKRTKSYRAAQRHARNQHLGQWLVC